jgi:hypothetical protein
MPGLNEARTRTACITKIQTAVTDLGHAVKIIASVHKRRILALTQCIGRRKHEKGALRPRRWAILL